MKYSLIIFSLLFSNALFASETTETKSDIDALRGEEIFTTVCADACHQAPDRSRLKPKQWRVVLNTMQVRMKSAGRTPLTENQNKRLLEYLSQED
ncbi:MAG: hypothetical protein KAT90_09060 [Gammaproteobacteria bacterium]|nr:hypothetical protein [Gammaproteobacteria bacterium]